MSGNILFLGNKIFEIPPFFQTRPGDLGKKVHACSLRFSALKGQGPCGGKGPVLRPPQSIATQVARVEEEKEQNKSRQIKIN